MVVPAIRRGRAGQLAADRAARERRGVDVQVVPGRRGEDLRDERPGDTGAPGGLAVRARSRERDHHRPGDAGCAPLWMCIATAAPTEVVGGDLVADLALAGAQPEQSPFRLPTGSPAGLSTLPVIVMLKAVPPLTARSVFGQRACRRRNDVRRMVGMGPERACRDPQLHVRLGRRPRAMADRPRLVASFRAFALVNATVKAASAAMSKMNRFIDTPPLVVGLVPRSTRPAGAAVLLRDVDLGLLELSRSSRRRSTSTR